MAIPQTNNDVAFLLADFGRFIDIPDLSFDERNSCWLTIQDTVLGLTYQDPSRGILVQGIIGTFTEKTQPNVFSTILAANHIAFMEGRGCLSYDTEAHALLWNDRLQPRGMTVQMFHEAIVRAARHIELWSTEFENLTATVAEDTTRDLDPLDTYAFMIRA